jgi:tRNA(Arg) A34 adenosine deaminase TadA
MNSDFFMQKAIELSIKNINNNGGPFGCVIVKNNKIISEGVNGVTQNNDPTAHAEIVAIRNACTELNTFDLSGCEMYTSCEPCPMCLSAIYWSHIDIVYYGNSRENAAEIEFDDKFIYDEIKKDISARKIPLKRILKDEAIKAFNLWAQTENKTNEFFFRTNSPIRKLRFFKLFAQSCFGTSCICLSGSNNFLSATCI